MPAYVESTSPPYRFCGVSLAETPIFTTLISKKAALCNYWWW